MSSHIQKSCVGLEATLSDGKKKYGDKVNALLSAWEHVTNFIPAATPEATQSLIEWVHKHTLKLVLRGEWPKLSPATKTHLGVTLQRCSTHLGRHPAAPRCATLIALVHDPWTRPALDVILNGQLDPGLEEEFCCTEKGELLTMRLRILCEDRCEDIAVNLAAACVRSLRRNDRLRSVCEAQHVQYMIDVYIVLLYKLKRTQDIFAQLKLMDLGEGLELVQRLGGESQTMYGQARVWKNSTRAAELVAQYLVTAGMVRPVDETGSSTLERIINSWALLHSKLKDMAPTLPGMIRKLIEPAESAQHIYIFCAVLGKHFGGNIKPLMIELYIRALTTDMNELETQKAKSDKEKVRETAKRLSAQFLKLADVLVENVGIARECVLTAFSLQPTRLCYDRIREMAIACGKAKSEVDPIDENICPGELANLLDTGQERAGGAGRRSSTSDAALSRRVEAKELLTGVDSTECSRVLTKFPTPSRKKELNNADRCLLHPKRDPSSSGPLGELCFNCGEFTGIEAVVKAPEITPRNIERTLDALILIKGDAVTGSANYDEKSAPNQVLDAEKLGVSPQLCDDLAVVLSSPRYHMLSWVLDWKELNGLCEKYLENAEEMRNTNKELKYLNIDYSQFKDWPLEEDTTKDVFFGIEKGYEQWADVRSSDEDSEEFGSFQPAGPYKRSLTRRSLEDTTDSDSGGVLRLRRTARARKIHRLASTDSDYDEDIANADSKQPHFRVANGRNQDTETDTDTNTQDSQTDSLGSDGCRQDKKPKNKPTPGKDNISGKNRGKSKLTLESMSHFHMLVNDGVRCSADDVSSSDISSNDIITLFSADMDESKCETIKGSAYNAETPLIITEKRSDPAVLKSLRMFRPQNVKKPTRITQILQKNLLNKTKDTSLGHNTTGLSKFSPMLGTLNLNPKIILTRTDEVKKKLISPSKKLSPGDITSELLNLQKSMSFSPNKNPTIVTNEKSSGCLGGLGSADGDSRVARSLKPTKRGASNFLKSTGIQGKTKYDILAKAVRDSDILAKNVPGLNTLDMMVPPRVQPTVNIVQLSRSISQSPNPGPLNSGGTPPRNRSSSVAGGGIQLPGTPTSTGHDSGVGMSPADRTPPSRSILQDIGEEANQPPDASPPGNSLSNIEQASPKLIENRRGSSCISPKKSPSPISTSNPVTSMTPVAVSSEQLQIVCKPDGTYRLAAINSTASQSSSQCSQSTQSSLPGQRSTLTLQTLDDNHFSPQQQTQRGLECSGSSNRAIYDGLNAVNVKPVHQASQNTPSGLPKFQQAFGKTIYTLSSEPTTVSDSATTETISQLTAASKTTNLSKAVQTSVQNTQTNAGVSVQSITNITNLQLSTSGRQILNIVQTPESSSSGGGSGVVVTSSGNVNTNVNNPTLAQLVQTTTSPGVIYTHKIPVTISTTNPSQLNIIPHTISRTTSAQGNRTPVVKLNIIRTGAPLGQQNIAGAIQAVLTAPRVQQNVRHDNLIGSPIDVPTNQVSSTTLEQLREFESVLEQVKERSTVQPQHQSTGVATTTVQTQTQTQTQSQTQTILHQSQQAGKHHTVTSSLAQQLHLISSRATAVNNEFTTAQNTVTFQQETYPQQKVSLAYVDQAPTITQKVVSAPTPVVVVTSYCQPAASPALSVTSQSSSSPCVTPAPAPLPSAGKTPPSANAKPGGKKSVPKTVKTSASNTSKAPPIPKPQQKPQEDEQTAQRIYAILDEYAEQLRNSPDLNNKPAPRRRSNPPTNPSQSSKRKKPGSSKSKPPGQQSSELSPGTDDHGRTMGSEDSSSGVVHVQDSPVGVSGCTEDGQTTMSHENTSTDVRNLANDSNDAIELNVKRRNLIFSDQSNAVGQPRAVIVQEAVQNATVSVSEALASVTAKIGSTAVLVPGTNYILPMNLMKGGQQFTIVSGGSKLLATVPTTVRTSSTGVVSNALVLQSFLNQAGKIIAQPTQMKQVKMPTLQTLNTNQSLAQPQQHHHHVHHQHHQQPHPHHASQSPTVVISQSSTPVTQFSNDPVDRNNSDSTSKIDVPTSTVMPLQETTGNAIIVNKSPTIGLLQRNINDYAENQQICGVITSTPSLTLQSTRLFNSSIAKLTAPAGMKTENVVCLTSATMTQSPEQKYLREDGGGNDNVSQPENPIPIQTETIALSFAPRSGVSVINAMENEIRNKDITASTAGAGNDKIISPKSTKRKFDNEPAAEMLPKGTNSNIASTVLTTLQNQCKPEIATVPCNNDSASKQASADQFIVSDVDGVVASSDAQETTIQRMNENVADTESRVGNGLLCGNARLQEAWEPERKPSSPDTPWRYVPASSSQLGLEPLKVYSSRENENPENVGGGVHSVVHIINKGQGVEMASGGQIYQTTTTTTTTSTKKYFMNHTLEPFQQYSNRSQIKTQLNPRSDRELLQQRMERKAAAIERELRLQKSLSEECEDLGVDEPSTSDLFPEADLLFDTNHSPSFDQSSQDATCSQPLGLKSYNPTSYFRPLDSSSSSRDASPVTDFKSIERRKNTVQRTRTMKDMMKRTKRGRADDSLVIRNHSKQSRLDMQGVELSHDETSNSNSDASSRLSPSNLMPGIKADGTQGCTGGHHRLTVNSRVKSKSSSPSSTFNLLPTSTMKLQDTDDPDDPDSTATITNNLSIASSGDESLTLMGGGTADVTMPSPLSPTTGPLLSTHKYTYANKKRSLCNTARKDYLSWESPLSDHGRTSSEEDEEGSSIGESIGSQPEENTAINGLEGTVTPPTIGRKSPNDYCSSYLNKRRRNQLKVNARVLLNRNDVKGLGTASTLMKRTKNDLHLESGAVSSDKTSEPSDDESTHHPPHSADLNCRARRSSLRGHVKKGCACCNGSPERPKKKSVKLDQKLKKRLASKQLVRKR